MLNVKSLPTKEVKHTVALAPRHMEKQRKWGCVGVEGRQASASTASCPVGQANRELAAGYLSDLSDLMLPVINQSSGDPSIDVY